MECVQEDTCDAFEYNKVPPTENANVGRYRCELWLGLDMAGTGVDNVDGAQCWVKKNKTRKGYFWTVVIIGGFCSIPACIYYYKKSKGDFDEDDKAQNEGGDYYHRFVDTELT